MSLPTGQQVKDFFKSLWARAMADFRYLWENDKIFLIIFGVLIAVAKGTAIMVNYLTYKSTLEVNATVKKDDVLKGQEDAAKSQADALVKQADALGSQSQTVTSDWDKKK